MHTLAFAEIIESVVLKHNTEHKTTHHSARNIKSSSCPPLRCSHSAVTDRELHPWPYGTRPPGVLKSLPVLRRAMSSVRDRLAECEHRNGGHLVDVIMFQDH